MTKVYATQPSRQTGFTLFLTGLPGAGKTTLAYALCSELEQRFKREVTLLDGDEVRKLLSSELGYSREHRRLNVLRQGFVATEVTRHGGIAICALIAPYQFDRDEVRTQIKRFGRFIEIYLNASLEICERRDVKGLYAKAHAGKLLHMTGVDDPYEPPRNPEILIDSGTLSVESECHCVIDYLLTHKLIKPVT
jgi:sulfate adenylyltransferase